MTRRAAREPAYVYEDDLRFVLSLIDWLHRHDPEGDSYISAGTLIIESKNDYPIGRLTLESGAEKWRFEPHHDEDML